MVPKERAFAFADGLRGFAALQVVILHYASVYFPVMARENGPARTSWDKWIADGPQFFILDGGTAVCIFFIISGFVLAHSFRNSSASIPSLLVRRTVRLGVPVAVGWVFALVLLLGIGVDHDALVQATGSDFVKRLYTQPLLPLGLLRDLLLNSMFLGYSPLSLFDGFPEMHVQSIGYALNPPFWTLHVEFWGSLLVIVLTRLERVASNTLGVVFIALAAFALCGASFYSLFVAGWLLSRLVSSTGLPARPTTPLVLPGLALMALGIIVTSARPVQVVEALRQGVEHFSVGGAVNTAAFQSCVGSLAIFTGVLLFPTARRLLTRTPSLLLGRLSFGMYLFHFPVLFTVSTGLYMGIRHIGHVPAAGIATAVGIGLTALLAYAFDRWLDKAVVRLSHRTGSLMERQRAQQSAH